MRERPTACHGQNSRGQELAWEDSGCQKNRINQKPKGKELSRGQEGGEERK
jgi:hypothetical protein